ncbi:MAG TPA: energy transducer TonB [Pyrinomonadaceae bacterium]|jgi:TonB family protein
MKLEVVVVAIVLALSAVLSDPPQIQKQFPRVALLQLSESNFGKSVTEHVVRTIKGDELVVLDQDQSRAAARGIGYNDSLNLTVREARELGAVLGSEFYFLIEAQTLRRSRSERPAYYESYASIFVVSARSGKLVHWTRPIFEAADKIEAEKGLLGQISAPEVRHHITLAMRRALEDERQQREIVTTDSVSIIEAFDDDAGNLEANGLRLPRPFRRLRPEYPMSAAKADAEATVDVLADIDANGKVVRVEITRWAGFGLDDVTTQTVRQLDFFPAQQNGKPIPIRVLLRYNFRKPAPTPTQN